MENIGLSYTSFPNFSLEYLTGFSFNNSSLSTINMRYSKLENLWQQI
ncbi:hypothetical protein DDW09_00390 [Sulfolobus sp. SCGC AB-777_L09]|nr:hypothetical protein DDW09_00390 [Sulfolobus sp. SCGC AB-777_L09]